MKGTLFSADFIKDTNGNLRLLELNTDTAFTNGALTHLDFTEFINLLSSSNITEVHVIYKQFHSNFVAKLADSIASSGTGITLTETLEDLNIIYPTVVEDSTSKFILRCAYDESAIFDSTYCKQKDQLLQLFHTNSDTGSIPQFFVSSSENSVDLLARVTNVGTVPDIALKDLANVHKSIEFFKVGGTGTVEENYDQFIAEHSTDTLILNYYSDNTLDRHQSIRSFNIIYGSNLNLLNLVDVKVDAVFDKPLSISYDPLVTSNLLDEKHYYEFTTNYPHFKGVGSYGGLFEDEQIVDVNGNPVTAASASLGDMYKSIFVSGSPDTDNVLLFTDWAYEGSSLPSGSYTTSSILVNKVKSPLSRKTISHIITETSASFRATGNQHLLVYDSGSNELRYKSIVEIDKDTEYLLNDNGGVVKIQTNDIEILEDEHFAYVLDFESVDTYVLYESGLNIKVVAHNACFPAGTGILLESGDVKNIEDVQEGDSVVSFDTENRKLTVGRVSKVNKSTQEDLIQIKTDLGQELKSTTGHKIYANGKWVFAKELKVGDKLINSNGGESIITEFEIIKGEFEVYHILNVGNDHTYFANSLLVHNFSATIACFPEGTLISLPEGGSKPIEEIGVGDEVVTFNEVTKEQEISTVYEILSPIHDDIVTYILEDGTEVSSTYDHPYYVDELELKSFYPEKTNDLYDIEKQVTKVSEGDLFIKQDGTKSPIKQIIPEIKENTQTYLLRVKGNHNFYANGILVHNK